MNLEGRLEVGLDLLVGSRPSLDSIRVRVGVTHTLHPKDFLSRPSS